MRYDDPNVPRSAVAGLIGAVLLFVIIVFLQALFFRMERAEVVRKVDSQQNDALARLRADQQELLNSYHMVDPKAGVVRIPIERAMEIEVAESQSAQSR
jgi:uncharacterized membrane protein